jgi:urease subunit gamma/beta
VRLTPREEERLLIFSAAELARRRLGRGRRLNVPESIALICDEVLEKAWDGCSLEEARQHGRDVLSREDVMEDVPAVVTHIEIEALFPSGTALVVVESPFGAPVSGPPHPVPGEVRTAPGAIVLRPSARRVSLAVRNTGTAPIYVTSHVDFASVNRALEFERGLAHGMRLDVAAGDSIGWMPGQTLEVRLVAATPQPATVDTTEGATS